MALTDENGGGIPATMLVGPATLAGNGGAMPYPVYMGGGQGNSDSGFGNDGNGWWIILLFIILFAAGGWNNNGGGNSGGGFGGGQPIIVNDGGSSNVQRGFDQAAIMGGISGNQAAIQGLSNQLCNCCSDMQNTVNQGFFGVQNTLCNGFAGVNSNLSNGFAQAEIAENARQMANMNQAFASQTAMAQGFNSLSSQFSDCCCENRLATERLNYTIATENCADRAAVSDGIRDVITNQNAGIQRILDQLCADKIDAKNERIADLERQLTMANLAASQTAQTARILADNERQTTALEQYLNPAPIPAYVVQNPNCCTNSCGCGSF